MSSKGWPSQEKEERIVAQYATIEPVRTLQHSLSVLAHQFVREIGTDLVEAGSTTIAIQATSHLVLSGDVIRFTSGVLSGQEVKVYAVSVNAIQLAEKLSVAPSAGDGFQILRHKYPVVEPTGEVKISGSFTEVATAADGGALPALTKVVSGYDGSAVQALKTDSNGELQVDVLSSALPTGAATSANQISTNNLLTTIDADTSTLSACVTLNKVQVDVASSALPTGAATSANQTSTNNLLTTIDADTGTIAACVTSNQVQTEINTIKGLVDSSNSSNTPLGIGGIYTGAWVENKNYASIQVGVKADQNSATDGLVMQFSSDGMTIHHTHQYSYLAASGGIGYLFQPEFKYYRIVFTNGAVAQTSFTLQTTLRSVPLFPSQYRVSNSITNETQVLMTRSVITGESSAGGGTFVNVKVSPSGALNTEATLAGLDPAVLGQDTMANSLPVVLASNQTAIPVTDNGSSLTVDGTVSATQSGTWNINNVSGTVSLPTGAATETTLAAIKTSVELLDNAVSGNELQVDIVSAPTLATNQVGRTVQNRARLDYSLTNVTTGAYVQLLASTSGAVSEIEIFDSSGQTLVLATGAALSEVDQIYVFPGGNGRVPLSIAGSTRVSIKAVSATANSGEIAINFYS